MQQKYESKDSNVWSLLFTVAFVGLVVLGYVYLESWGADFSVTVFEFIILALAIFRLIRLASYDSIAQFARDVFTDTTWEEQKDGTFLVTRTKPKSGFRRKCYELFVCPWCIGVWLSGAVVFFFFLTEIAWPFILLLALAGVASLFQLFANLIGWYAEGRKQEVEK